MGLPRGHGKPEDKDLANLSATCSLWTHPRTLHSSTVLHGMMVLHWKADCHPLWVASSSVHVALLAPSPWKQGVEAIDVVAEQKQAHLYRNLSQVRCGVVNDQLLQVSSHAGCLGYAFEVYCARH